MNITDVRVRKVAKEGKMKAVVSVTIDDEFVVHDIKVIEGEKGLFIAMPSRKASDGEYRDIAHPINSSTRERIQAIILDKYQEVMAEEAENDVLMEAAEQVWLSVTDSGERFAQLTTWELRLHRIIMKLLLCRETCRVAASFVVDISSKYSYSNAIFVIKS